jgi:hypothetical protein
MAIIERPRFEDCTGHNDCDDGIYADALDEYSTKLEEYADTLENRCKTLDLDNKTLKAWSDSLEKYLKDVELALRMAIADATPRVVDWGLIADKRGERPRYNYYNDCIFSETKAVSNFYIAIASKQRLQERLDIELESKAQAAETTEIKSVNGETVQFKKEGRQ